MKNKSKNMFLFFLSILITTGMLASTSLADTPHWDVNWNFRKQIAITNNVSTTLYNYSMMVTLDTAGLISQGKMQSDCGDIRIIEDGVEINYGIKNPNSASTEIYFIANDLIVGDNNDIYIYYGNPDADNGFVENWKDAFYIWWDDFDSDRGWYDAWGRGGYYTVSDGYMTVYFSPYTDVVWIPADGSSFPMDGRVGIKTEAKMMVLNCRLCQGQIRLAPPGEWPGLSILHLSCGHQDFSVGFSPRLHHPVTANTWYASEFVYNRLTGDWRSKLKDEFNVDLELVAGNRPALESDDFSTIIIAGCNNNNPRVDYIYLRYFIEPEPSYSLGEEEYVSEPACTGCNLCPWELHGPESDMVIGVHGFGAAALDGYLYAVGGQTDTSGYGTNHVQKYDPETDEWVQVASLQQKRHSLDCAVVDGYIYAIGGHVYNSMNTNERYDPSTNTWAFMAPKPTPVSGPGVAVGCDGKIYTFGGHRYGSNQSVIEVYDPGTNSWQNVGNMPAPGQPWRAATLGSKIYLAGGKLGGIYDLLWCYDPATGIWDADLPRLNCPRQNHELVVVGDCLYAIGGSNSDGYLNSVEWWKPGELSWTLAESLNGPRGQLGAEAIGNEIYAFGGTQPGTGTLSSVESAVVSCSITVDIDIKPGSCPNPLNVKSKGVLPIAILGTGDYDVTAIDPTSIRLAGVEPLRSGYEDVATPVSDSNDCNCTTDGADGFLDLTLKFATQRIVEAIGDVNDGDVRVLTLTGVLYDPVPFETPIEGTDCIVIRGRHKAINLADINKDGVVDNIDFAIIAENWLQSSIVED